MNVIRDLVGVDFPLFAFSHCRDVVAAVSRAGGFGVLGGSSFTPESLERELKWIDEHVNGMPYGIDILVPEHQSLGPATDMESLSALVPKEHIDFAVALLRKHGITVQSADVIDKLPPA